MFYMFYFSYDLSHIFKYFFNMAFTLLFIRFNNFNFLPYF